MQWLRAGDSWTRCAARRDGTKGGGTRLRGVTGHRGGNWLESCLLFLFHEALLHLGIEASDYFHHGGECIRVTQASKFIFNIVLETAVEAIMEGQFIPGNVLPEPLEFDNICGH